ncbi:alpha/beta hydrolase [Terrilactibacillus laevilacticus]|uniref:Alpha/beta hydrolase n=1 Tax=Terrilactibacillus laevilacticus TaxID=1380157 RepID=A0ABW5PUG6_9BACI|nr:alpha/beta hydrolase [Terrilactibacillus laevilacticus]
MRTLKMALDNNHKILTCYLLENSNEFKVNERRPAVIICPGGGYDFTSDREAEPIAMRFAAEGYHTFVLRYTCISDKTPLFPQPLIELAKTVHLLYKNADDWLIDKEKITLCGFSAGGHLVATYGTKWHEDWLSEKVSLPSEERKPSALLLCYPVINLTSGWPGDEIKNKKYSQLLGEEIKLEQKLEEFDASKHVSVHTPPTFIWHTSNDRVVPVSNSLQFISSLDKSHIPFESHIFENGVHGLSLANEVTARDDRHINDAVKEWIPLALTWLKQMRLN